MRVCGAPQPTGASLPTEAVSTGWEGVLMEGGATEAKIPSSV